MPARIWSIRAGREEVGAVGREVICASRPKDKG